MDCPGGEFLPRAALPRHKDGGVVVLRYLANLRTEGARAFGFSDKFPRKNRPDHRSFPETVPVKQRSPRANILKRGRRRNCAGGPSDRIIRS